jgi:hypothetical protein
MDRLMRLASRMRNSVRTLTRSGGLCRERRVDARNLCEILHDHVCHIANVIRQCDLQKITIDFPSSR